jgi:hypothetical protein
MIDPVEHIIMVALNAAGIRFVRDNEADLDFYLPDYDTYIEVKQFHSKRILEQMSRVPNVIVIQGRTAAETFSKALWKCPIPKQLPTY